MTDILVLGGGYTGVTAAIRLARKARSTGARVTLVNASPRFTERLRLHQTAAGERLADHALSDVLAGSGVELVVGRVAAIDPELRQVRLHSDAPERPALDGDAAPHGDAAEPPVLRYDKLIYALGTVTDATVPGVAEHAHVFDDYTATVRLSRRLDTLTRGTVVVAGGGLTGVEAVTELAEARPHLRVVLLTRGRPGSMMGQAARAYLDRALERLGVEVRSGVSITKVLPDGVELGDGELIHSDATIWTTGTRALPLAAEAGLSVDARGRIVVDEVLRSVSHPDVYAVGDAAAITQKFGVMHGTCQGGIPTGLGAADSLAATLRGRTPPPFRFGYVHQPVSLGRKDAVIQFTRPDDSPRRGYLTGRAAIAYKETVSSSPITLWKLLKRGLVPVRVFGLTAGRA
ncbi:NAD(P)/FAD-dependent oxidoreductase [Nonomuraea gerenzanensis]|uniref:NADH dehydrogenase n=1 Tax=Nonomuraea gerenzanensis TaxID=93944 RepID=A0A1M4E7J0_9ACTN|nr:FAD-dependent oxidoreductase [Nonomuraea gerenzanensis]UBU17043.1 FAD-dependent oxidoreductase [Nonomuraea gerenzanensis]SBO94775.1 NADH dehydrogenase [Nonomuraea gerenzanensis]